MNEQGDPGKSLAFIAEHLQALEAAHPALLGDIRALRQAILKGSQLLPRDCENLATHLRKTQALLTSAAQACQEMILSLTEPTSHPSVAESPEFSGTAGVFERRRALRRPFGGVAEVSTACPDVHIVGLVTELSRFGCFVRTQEPLPVGTNVSLRITHKGNECVTPGEVADVLNRNGMGIKFTVITQADEALLEDWLRQTLM